MSGAPFNLPAEILTVIANHLSSLRDLRNLRAVNRAFCVAATPGAFRTAAATNRRGSARRLLRLLEAEHLACHVQEVTYRDAAAYAYGGALFPVPPGCGYGPRVANPLVAAFTLAVHLPGGLTALRFVFHPTLPHVPRYARRSGPLHLQHALLATVSAAGPHLRALTLTNLAPLPYALFAAPALHATLSALTHLHISTARAGCVTDDVRDAYCEFWRDTVNRCVLPHLAQVTSLRLADDLELFPGYSMIIFADNATTLPALKYLAVRSLWIGDNGDGRDSVSEFVGRHERLEWIDMWNGASRVRWVRRTHADPLDTSAYEDPPSVAPCACGLET